MSRRPRTHDRPSAARPSPVTAAILAGVAVLTFLVGFGVSSGAVGRVGLPTGSARIADGLSSTSDHAVVAERRGVPDGTGKLAATVAGLLLVATAMVVVGLADRSARVQYAHLVRRPSGRSPPGSRVPTS